MALSEQGVARINAALDAAKREPQVPLVRVA